MLTVREVSERLNVSPKVVYGLIARGELRALRVGKGYRVAEADLDAFQTAVEVRPREVAPVPSRRASRRDGAPRRLRALLEEEQA